MTAVTEKNAIETEDFKGVQSEKGDILSLGVILLEMLCAYKEIKVEKPVERLSVALLEELEAEERKLVNLLMAENRPSVVKLKRTPEFNAFRNRCKNVE